MRTKFCYDCPLCMTQLTKTHLRDPGRGNPRVIAIFSYRYDADLVPDMLANLAPFIHGWVGWDDRGADAVMSHEPERRNRLLAAARDMGADWILAADPDERYEDRLKDRMPVLTRTPALWTIRTREMFTPTCYRTDGIWGHKGKVVLFPAKFATGASGKAFHGGWVSSDAPIARRDSGINLYHLRMASPARRRHRRDTYAAMDPLRKSQKIGYDYLDDERGMVLRDIPTARKYSPVHHDDDQLWGPALGDLKRTVPDGIANKLLYINLLRNSGAAQTAAIIADDLRSAAPDDHDLTLLAAQTRIDAGDFASALTVLGRATDPVARVLRAKAQAGQGDINRALAELADDDDQVPAFHDLATELRGLAFVPFTDTRAPWRQWARGKTKIHEGTQMDQSALAVIVISYKSPPEVAQAVASVLAQDPPCEVVVVNSGGGAIRDHLAPQLNRIRLITTQSRLFAGAARNIGIVASRAPHVAFLASDCAADAGWVAARLAHHTRGARMVSSPVLPATRDNTASLTANLISHWRRRPELTDDQVLHYGVSYDRALLREIGAFDPDCRVGEDTDLNAAAEKVARIVWAPDVLTRHAYPMTLRSLIADNFRRGVRKAADRTYRDLTLWHGRQHGLLWRNRYHQARDAMAQNDGFSALRTLSGRLHVGASVTAEMLGAMAGAAKRRRDQPQGATMPRGFFAKTTIATIGKKSARKLFRKCRSLDKSGPRNPQVAVKKHDLLSRHGAIDCAEVEANRSLRMAPRLAPVWRRKAIAGLTGQNPEAALYDARMAFVLAPAERRVHATLADVYAAMNDEDNERRRRHMLAELEQAHTLWDTTD